MNKINIGFIVLMLFSQKVMATHNLILEKGETSDQESLKGLSQPYPQSSSLVRNRSESAPLVSTFSFSSLSEEDPKNKPKDLIPLAQLNSIDAEHEENPVSAMCDNSSFLQNNIEKQVVTGVRRPGSPPTLYESLPPLAQLLARSSTIAVMGAHGGDPSSPLRETMIEIQDRNSPLTKRKILLKKSGKGRELKGIQGYTAIDLRKFVEEHKKEAEEEKWGEMETSFAQLLQEISDNQQKLEKPFSEKHLNALDDSEQEIKKEKQKTKEEKWDEIEDFLEEFSQEGEGTQKTDEHLKEKELDNDEQEVKKEEEAQEGSQVNFSINLGDDYAPIKVVIPLKELRSLHNKKVSRILCPLSNSKDKDDKTQSF